MKVTRRANEGILSDIFLSYAREDRSLAEPLAKALEDRGWSVWWDRRLEAGEVWDEVIASKIEDAKIILVLWSPASTKSRWVKNEARFADEKGKLVPVLIRSAQIPLEFTHVQAEDLSAWRGHPSDNILGKLADSLARRLGPMPIGSVGPEERGLVWNHRLWLWSAVLLGLAGLGGGFFALTGGNHQTESGSNSTKAPKDASSAPQTMVESGSDSAKALKDESSAHQRTVIAIPGDKTLAEWTPGCLYEVRAERQADSVWRACFAFDPTECFIADGITQSVTGADKIKTGMPVFVTLSAARDLWAAGTLSTMNNGRYYVNLDTGLDCAKDGKPGLWAGGDGVIAPKRSD